MEILKTACLAIGFLLCLASAVFFCIVLANGANTASLAIGALSFGCGASVIIQVLTWD